MTQICSSSSAKYDTFEAFAFQKKEDCLSGRRRCHEAFHMFMKCIDTSNPTLCSHLFTCKECERPLTEKEKVLLGYSREEEVPDKRLKAVVIDGTTAGILTALPRYDRQLQLLSANSRLQRKHKFVRSKIFQDTVKRFTKIVRSRLRIIVTRKRILSTSSRHFRFALPTKKQSSSSKLKPLSKEAIACIRKLLLSDRCVCERPALNSPNRESQQHSALYKKVNANYKNQVGGTEVIRLLSSICKVIHRPPTPEQNSETQQNNSDATFNQEDNQEAVNNHEERESESGNGSETSTDSEQDHSGDDEDQPSNDEMETDIGDNDQEMIEEDEYNVSGSEGETEDDDEINDPDFNTRRRRRPSTSSQT